MKICPFSCKQLNTTQTHVITYFTVMHKLLYSRKSLLMIMFGETVWTKIITKKV